MKKIKLLLLLIPFTLFGQKYQYDEVQLMTAQGQLIQSWNADAFVTLVGDNFTIASDDDRLLQTICIKSIFDTSPYRQYQLASIKDSSYVENGITRTLQISKYVGLVYYDRVTILNDSTKRYMVIVPENNIGVVIYKNK